MLDILLLDEVRLKGGGARKEGDGVAFDARLDMLLVLDKLLVCTKGKEAVRPRPRPAFPACCVVLANACVALLCPKRPYAYLELDDA